LPALSGFSFRACLSMLLVSLGGKLNCIGAPQFEN